MADQTYLSSAPTPNRSVMGQVANTASFNSGLSGASQTVERDATIWTQSLYYQNLTNAQRGELLGWLAKLNGQENRAMLPPFGITQRGAFGGTCLVNGASQVGTQLVCDGVTATVTGWIKRGDYFTVNDELKMATQDSSSDGSGNITLVFTPRLRQSPSDGATVSTSGAGLVGRFKLVANSVQWALRPGGFSDLALDFEEDIST